MGRRRASSSEVRGALKFVLAGYRRGLAVMAGTSLLGGLAEAVFLVTVTRLAFAITEGSDRVGILANRFVSLNQALLLATALVAVRVTLGLVAVWQRARISVSVVAKIRRLLAGSFLNAAWEVQQAQRGGSLQALMGAYAGHASGLMNGFGAGVVASMNLIAMLALALAVDPLGATVMLGSVVVLGLLLRPLRRVIRRRARAANDAVMELNVAVNEASTLGMELHVFHVQGRAGDRLDERIEEHRTRSLRANFASGSMSTFYSALAYCALVGALSVAAQSNAANLTSLGAVMLVMLRSLTYGQALQGAIVNVQAAAPAVDDLLTSLDEFESGRRRDGGVALSDVAVLEADRVQFAYPDEPAVLHEIDFSIGPREVIGIVGPSGGGKSTLVQLLLGLRDPVDGAIRADGRDIREFAKADWARKVTFVPQASHLIAGSIADNIRFYRTNVTEDDIEGAARLAHLHDEIVEFPEGYDRLVGEQGGHLSGGQQQRLCIARALVEHPDVLILDEPTSALDVRSEHLIRTTLLGLRSEMTIVVIAHRLSTLDICDRIMVIQGGRLVGFDTPVELEHSNSFYREALQLSGLRA